MSSDQKKTFHESMTELKEALADLRDALIEPFEPIVRPFLNWLSRFFK